MNIFLLLGILFIVSFIFGHVLEKLRIPWIFAALLFGLGLSFGNPFQEITDSGSFQFMSQMGFFMLLFLIGFELDVRKILQSGKFIMKATFLIELTEMLLVGTALHFLFNLDWPIAILLALSFATVGEAILLPMLDEFKLVKTKIGQLILGIATFDDVFEILVLFAIILLAPMLLGGSVQQQVYDPLLIQALLVMLGLLLFVLLTVKKLKKEVAMMKVPNVATVLPLVFSIFFIFVGIDGSSEQNVAVLGALFAGIVAKSLLPVHFLEELEPQIKTITYGLFAPIFFLQVGIETDASYILSNVWIVILIGTIAYLAKIVGSFLVGRKELGNKPAIFMGVALGVRFSTSIVFLKILLDSQLISTEIYSAMLGTSILFKFVIPPLLALLVGKWGIDRLEKVKA